MAPVALGASDAHEDATDAAVDLTEDEVALPSPRRPSPIGRACTPEIYREVVEPWDAAPPDGVEQQAAAAARQHHRH